MDNEQTTPSTEALYAGWLQGHGARIAELERRTGAAFTVAFVALIVVALVAARALAVLQPKGGNQP